MRSSKKAFNDRLIFIGEYTIYMGLIFWDGNLPLFCAYSSTGQKIKVACIFNR